MLNHHHFQLWDYINAKRLTDLCSIHILELGKWQIPKTLQPEDYWLYFFKEGKHWKKLPKLLKNRPEMEQAMSVLRTFSEKEIEHARYQSRQDAIRVQLSDEAEKAELEKEKAKLKEENAGLEEKNAGLAEKNAGLAEKNAGLAEKNAGLAIEAENEKKSRRQAEAKIAEMEEKMAAVEEKMRQAGIEPNKQ